MSTCLEELEPQHHPYIPPQPSGSGRTPNAPEGKQRAPRPKSCCCCPSAESASGRTERAWSRNPSARMAEKGLCQNALGDVCPTPQPLLVSIYSYEGGSFKYSLTKDFRMDCNCPANLNCTFQSHWEGHRNADNIKLAMPTVTKDMYVLKN